MANIKSYSNKSYQNLNESLQRATAGNKVSVYVNEKERDIYGFFLKPLTLISYLNFIAKHHESLTLLELGCGNGSNSRIIIKMIREAVGFKGMIHVLYSDIFDDLLNEADRRSKEQFENDQLISWECVKVDFSDIESVEKFTNDYKNKVNITFSIKFFHNTPIKITNKIADCISRLSTDHSLFVCQFYIASAVKEKASLLVKKITSSPYQNALLMDVKGAARKLGRNGFKVAQTIEQKACKDHPFADHFQRHSVESYYLKA